MSDQADLVTRIVDRVLDVLFAKYPARTGLGVVLGGTFAFLARLFEPSIRSIAAIDATGAPLWGWLALGILILHIPTIRGLFKQQPIGDDVIDQALDLIERSNFTQAEKRQQYRNLIAQVSTSIAFKNSTQREVANVERSLGSPDKR
jgi:hypothetical protein